MARDGSLTTPGWPATPAVAQLATSETTAWCLTACYSIPSDVDELNVCASSSREWMLSLR